MISFEFTTVDKLEDFDELGLEHWNSFNNKTPEFDKEFLKNFTVLQAKHNNRTIGYIFYLIFKAPYYNEFWCQIDMFYLKPEYRGQGTGKQMFNMVEEEAKKNKVSKILSSFNLKQPLEGFYKSMGYSQTHVAVAKEI